MNVSGSKVHVAIPTVACVVVGTLTAIQSRMNGELSIKMNNGIEAAVYSFGSGFIVMILVVLLSRKVRSGLAAVPVAIRNGGIRWWQILGGTLGGFFVAVQSSVVPLIGVAVFTIAIVAGQSTNSLVVDRIGLGPAGKQVITWQRVAGAILAIIAVSLAVAPRLSSGSIPILPVVFAFIAGLLIAVQGAINGRVSMISGQPLSAAFLNFLFGFIVLGTTLGISIGFMGKGLSGVMVAPWWAYLGGIIGIVFISIAAWSVPIIGVLMFALLSISGQLVGSMALDFFAPTPGSEITSSLIIGVLLAFVAVGVTALNRPSGR
jgi:transporter family-2 protein